MVEKMVIEGYDITLKVAVADEHDCTEDCPEDLSCWDVRRPPTEDEADELFTMLCDTLAKRHQFVGSAQLSDPSMMTLYVEAELVPWWRNTWATIQGRALWWARDRWRLQRRRSRSRE